MSKRDGKGFFGKIYFEDNAEIQVYIRNLVNGYITGIPEEHFLALLGKVVDARLDKEGSWLRNFLESKLEKVISSVLGNDSYHNGTRSETVRGMAKTAVEKKVAEIVTEDLVRSVVANRLEGLIQTQVKQATEKVIANLVATSLNKE